jgi:hypothetical protein
MEELSAAHTPIQSKVDALGTPCHVNITTSPEAATTLVLTENAKNLAGTSWLRRHRHDGRENSKHVQPHRFKAQRATVQHNGRAAARTPLHSVLQQPSRRRNT